MVVSFATTTHDEFLLVSLGWPRSTAIEVGFLLMTHESIFLLENLIIDLHSLTPTRLF